MDGTKTWPFPNASVSDCYSVKEFKADEPKEVPAFEPPPMIGMGRPLASVIHELLGNLDPDPDRQGLEETPARVAKAWAFWTKGYAENPAEILKVFDDGANGYDEMVSVCNIPVYSHCEHHMAPIFGVATVAYIPDGRIVGLSKLSRLVDCFARRLQVQERLTTQIADSLQEHLNPKGVGVWIKARHMCMESRGICQQGHHTVTTALRGVIKEDLSARAEFLALTR
nr:GTP cyclohydrolase [Achromobacter phage vB_Ade_ART]